MQIKISEIKINPGRRDTQQRRHKTSKIFWRRSHGFISIIAKSFRKIDVLSFIFLLLVHKVKPRKREQYQQEHRAELADFEAAEHFLKELKASGEAITPKGSALTICPRRS